MSGDEDFVRVSVRFGTDAWWGVGEMTCAIHTIIREPGEWGIHTIIWGWGWR